MILRIGEDTSTKGRDRVHCLKVESQLAQVRGGAPDGLARLTRRLTKIALKFLESWISPNTLGGGALTDAFVCLPERGLLVVKAA